MSSDQRRFINTPLGNVTLLLAGVLLGAFVGEPIKNLINRPRLSFDVVEIRSTTPFKSQWLMPLTPADQANLAKEIGGNDWRKKINTNKLTYGDILQRRDDLKNVHIAYPTLQNHSAWKIAPNTDYTAFYVSNREYIDTVLEYTSRLKGVSVQDRRKAQQFRSTNLQRPINPMNIIGALMGANQNRPPPPNAKDIVALVGTHHTKVVTETKEFLQTLSDVIDRVDPTSPVPTFTLTIDVSNVGGKPTSINPVGTLAVKTDSPKPNDSISVLFILEEDDEEFGLVQNGERRRFTYRARASVLPTTQLRTFSSPEFLKRYNELQSKQIDGLRLLEPLYRSGLRDCSITIHWATGKKKSVKSQFGESQSLVRLEAALQ